MALNPFVSLFGRLVARSGRKRGNRQTDGRTSTVTLAAHARRGLRELINPFTLSFKIIMKSMCMLIVTALVI